MIGSFPKGFGYPEDENDIHSNDVNERALAGEVKPRILIMGLRRYAIRHMTCPLLLSFTVVHYCCPLLLSSTLLHSIGHWFDCYLFLRSGKSSIQKVVFHKMSPNETLFLESTNKIVKDGMFLTTTTSTPNLRAIRRTFSSILVWNYLLDP